MFFYLFGPKVPLPERSIFSSDPCSEVCPPSSPLSHPSVHFRQLDHRQICRNSWHSWNPSRIFPPGWDSISLRCDYTQEGLTEKKKKITGGFAPDRIHKINVKRVNNSEIYILCSKNDNLKNHSSLTQDTVQRITFLVTLSLYERKVIA